MKKDLLKKQAGLEIPAQKIRFRPAIAIFLCIALLIQLGASVSVAESYPDETGLCVHHAQHSKECQVKNEGRPCGHIHDGTCGYIEGIEESCTHIHDKNCGFLEGDGSVSCGYSCGKCLNRWSWLDEKGRLVFAEGKWRLDVPGADEENPVTRDALAGLLPDQVAAETTSGGAVKLNLDWDLETSFPEKAHTGVYPLNAKLPEDYTLTAEADPLTVILSLGGGQMYRDPVPNVPVNGDGNIHKFVSSWKYLLDTEIQCDADYNYSTELRLVGLPNDKEKLKEILENALPRRIEGTGYYSADLIAAGFQLKPGSPTAGNVTGYVDLEWNIQEVLDKTSAIQSGMELTFYAKPVSRPGYLLRINTNDPNWKTMGGDEVDTAESEEVLNLTVTLHQIDWDNHIIPGVDPDSTTVNLFDYWVTPEGESPENGDLLEINHYHKRDPNQTAPNAYPLSCSTEDAWYQGINRNHLLMFGYGGVVHAGLWNKGSGQSTPYGKAYAGMERIVKPMLLDGYPEINLDRAEKVLAVDENSPGLSALDRKLIRDVTQVGDYKLAGEHSGAQAGTHPESGEPVFSYDGTDIQNISSTLLSFWERDTGKTVENGEESLAYLFDPETPDPNKKSYTHVSGLFTLDDEGYYSYNMRESFAQFDGAEGENNGQNRFILYDAPATLRTDGTDSVGNFLPFNTKEEVFSGENPDGELFSTVKCQSGKMNHYLGMTIETTFRQPTGGTVNIGANRNVPMTFKFSGDDDVWIFIDDVLVMDLGGSHSELFGLIDFSTGEVTVGRGFDTYGIPEDHEVEANTAYTTTIKEMFEYAGAAGSVNWRGNTFASDTSHTLKMFYLERGNYDSSLAIRFNLQPQLYQEVKKVDQNGIPLEGVEFALYDAERLPGDGDPDRPLYCTNTVDGKAINIKELDRNADPVAVVVSGPDGIARFQNEDGSPFNFADRYDPDTGAGRYYILHETKTLPGYRTLPVDIVLEFDINTTMFVVANRWTTGSYASFTSNVTGFGGITYGKYDPATGMVDSAGIRVSRNSQERGLIFAVPLLLNRVTGKWNAMYGDNIEGFYVVPDEITDAPSMRKALLKAALHQTQYGHNWYLRWNEELHQLEGSLSDMPSRADRYRHINPDGDMRLLYFIIEPDAFSLFADAEDTSDERYQAIRDYVNEKIAELGPDPGKAEIEKVMDTAAEFICGDPKEDYGVRNVSMMDASQFNQDFRSLIYIPNEQRQLRVQKVDQDGLPVNGTEFTLYRDQACTETVASGVTADVDGQDGVLVFQPRAPKDEQDRIKSGYAEVEWITDPHDANGDYYLKETNAPAGYHLNPTVIPVHVGIYSIYADAGTKDNGVTVMAGVGKLAQTMAKYAMESDVDITLRDITAIAQGQEAGSFDLYGWEDVTLEGTDVKRDMALHYGMNAVVDYGLHDLDGGKFFTPFFVTDTGFIRTRVQQNWPALNSPIYGEAKNDVNKENLGDRDLTCLFSLLNVVVVTDQTNPLTETGSLAVKKTVIGNAGEEDYTKHFRFTIRLTGPDGAELKNEFYFYGTDKSGYIRSGEIIPLHHDEEIVILGLPVGTAFSVTEEGGNQDGWYVSPVTGTISGSIRNGRVESAHFVNSHEPPKGGLVVRKTVTQGEKDRPFRFSVMLSDTSINGRYGEMVFRNGAAFFELKHGESKTARDLPEGTRYTVMETLDEDYECEPSTGIITGEIGEKSREAAFTNTQKEVQEIKEQVTVLKKWVLDDGGTAADSVAVCLYRDGKEYDRAVLSAENGWSYTWKGLDKAYHWTVKEAEIPDGFTVSVIQQENTVIITNDDKPSVSSDPDGPDESSKPDGPDESSKPDGPDESSRPDGPDESSRPDGPDESSRPDGPDQSSKPDGPDESSKPDGPDQSSKPDGPDQSSKPDGPAGSEDPRKTPELPQTGMVWYPVWLLLAAGIVLTCLGLWNRKRHEK